MLRSLHLIEVESIIAKKKKKKKKKKKAYTVPRSLKAPERISMISGSDFQMFLFS